MRSGFRSFIAKRYVHAGKGEGAISFLSLLSFLGVFLGISILIIVLSVMYGLRQQITDDLTQGREHLTIESAKAGTGLEGFESLLKRLDKEEGVVFSYPYVSGQVLASYNRGLANGTMIGADLEDLKRQEGFLSDPRMKSFEGFRFVMDQGLQRQLGFLKKDEKVRFISPKGDTTVFGWTPRTKKFKFSALNVSPDQGIQSQGDPRFYVPFEQGQIFLKFEGQASHIGVFLDDYQKAGALKKKWRSFLGKDYLVLDWQDQNQVFMKAVDMERFAMAIVLFLIILVSLFNVVVGQVMLVRHKTKEIAILRSMGVSRRSILLIFLYASSLITVLGVIAGTVVGLLGATYLNSLALVLMRFKTWLEGVFSISIPNNGVLETLSSLPSIIHYGPIVVIILLSLIAAFLAALYPALQAAKLNPVEALRDE